MRRRGSGSALNRKDTASCSSRGDILLHMEKNIFVVRKNLLIVTTLRNKKKDYLCCRKALDSIIKFNDTLKWSAEESL